MRHAEPLPLAAKVGEPLIELLRNSGHTGSLSSFDRARFKRQIAEVAKTDARTAFILGGVLATLEGDAEEGARSIEAARRLNDPSADSQLLYLLSNLGFAHRSLELARNAMKPGVHDLSHMVRAATSIGAVVTALRAVDEATAANQVLAPVANDSIATCRLAAHALSLAGRTEDELVAMIDVAGEILRKNRLLWLGSAPHVIALSGNEGDDSAPGVHYLFRLDVTATEASSLTYQLVDDLVSRSLDHSGLSVAFIGAKIADAEAA